MRISFMRRAFFISLVLFFASISVTADTADPPITHFLCSRAEVKHVLAAFSKMTGRTVAPVMGLELKGRVTLNLRNVTWEEVLTEALDQVDLVWESVDTHIIVKRPIWNEKIGSRAV